jgi:hypothetical protein
MLEREPKLAPGSGLETDHEPATIRSLDPDPHRIHYEIGLEHVRRLAECH